MKIIGLIAEYNPFHLGHLYQINKIKELYPESIIIVIINSTFTQRGDISIINKWNKTTIALNNQIDLVIELPTIFATQSADIFAKGALEILNYLKIDTLVFGTETDNINELINAANIQLTNPKYHELTKKYLDDGINYPTALSKALEFFTNKKISTPNDLLALSYIKEIKNNKYNIEPLAIKRTNDYHSKVINNNIVNASLIRNLIDNKKKFDKFIPKYPKEFIYQYININSFFTYLKFMIYNNKDNLNKIVTVDEGIENRIIKNITNSNSWKELVNNIKTKRYTYNKINRMLIHILINFTKEEQNQAKIDYIRILGFNNRGKLYLNNIKKTIPLPIITNYKKNISKLLDIEYRINSIYSLIVDESLIKKEKTNSIIIK